MAVAEAEPLGHRRRPRRLTWVVVVVVGLVGATLAGCSRSDGSELEEVAALRERQARSAAAEAGLDESVQAFLGRAARAPVARFSATYQSGAERIVVHQVPPRRRVDVLVGGVARDAVVVGGDGEEPVRCERPAGKPWTCRLDPDADADVGAFTPELVARTVESLAAGASAFRTTVVDQRVAGVPARCLRSTPLADGSGTTSQLCIAPDGVPLLLDRGDGSPVLRAVAYVASASDADVRRPDRS